MSGMHALMLRYALAVVGGYQAAAIFLGWAIHHACPAAIRLADVLHRCQ